MTGEHEAEALKHFKKVDPILYKAVKPHIGSLSSWVSEKRTSNQLFAALVSSVVGQQLSTKAADTIRTRLIEACDGAITPEAIRKLTVPRMRKAGLSAAKVKTIKELAKAVQNGLNLPALRRVPEAEAIQELTKVWGIGVWTAEMFLIFALGRLDVFSPGDLGLVRAIEELYGVPKGSHAREYVAIAERWSPYRSVASLALWRYRDTP